MEPEVSRKSILPVTILVAALLVGGGLVANRIQKGAPATFSEKEALLSVPTINSDDHYLGNPKAKIVIIEYSDYDCSFCAGYFQNMKKIIEQLGKGGRLVWVHRHMPLFQIHETAKIKAEAAECANYIAGDDKFWQMSSEFYDSTLNLPGSTSGDIYTVADKIGLDKEDLKVCLDEGRFTALVDAQYAESYAAGGRGTPFTVIIVGDERYKVGESLPYLELRSLVESLLNK